jgi:hypothetical protein
MLDERVSSSRPLQHHLVGRTRLAGRGGRPIPMLVERVIAGQTCCRSLDLRWVARWPVDAVTRALHADSDPVSHRL